MDWAQFVTDHENRLYRAALNLLADPQEAEDAVQDAFVKYLEKAPAHLENPGGWLMRVTVNGCKSRLRRKWREVQELPETLPAPEPREREELTELFALPPEERLAVHLFYYEGYATDEIAKIMSCAPGTVRSRLSRARQRLKKLLIDAQEGDAL